MACSSDACPWSRSSQAAGLIRPLACQGPPRCAIRPPPSMSTTRAAASCPVCRPPGSAPSPAPIRSSQFYPSEHAREPAGTADRLPPGSRGPTPVIRGPSPKGPEGRPDQRRTTDPPHPQSNRRGPRPSPTSHGSARDGRRRHPGTRASPRERPDGHTARRSPRGGSSDRARPPSVPPWPSPRRYRHPWPPRQHRNLMRRAAGRGRSEPAVELRADSRDSSPDPSGPPRAFADQSQTDSRCRHPGAWRMACARSPWPSSQERPEQAVEADLGVAGRGPGRVVRELVQALACCPRGTDLGDRHRRMRGRSAPDAVRSLTPATATSGPGSRGDEIPHGLAIQRGAIRVMRAQVGREVCAEDLLDGRPSPGEREGEEER